MDQIYNSDKPIDGKNLDRFNRYKFSSRVAQTIINRKSNEGLVIGLYGMWGEGKTSVLNMIQNEFVEDENILVVKFNPWRFKDEDALILNFFTNLSSVLDKDLKNSKEKLGGFLKKYGAGVGIAVFNVDLIKLGESLSDTDLEQQKNRVNDFLKESDKKVVVIVDDIDRLDKEELYSLFKLIKLTGDFSNTYYILSFDDEMVASAIGERYASGDKLSGYNFLEKIIQVPLRIPQAQSKDLLTYTFELLNNVLKESQLDLKEEETQNIGALISQNILNRIKTPSLAIQYANSLSFLIPLLRGEVNNSDLIIFEGIKIFYPEFYHFIKDNPNYFIESYYGYSNTKDNTKAEELQNEFEKLSSPYSKEDKVSVLNLLKVLFPYTKEVFENYSFRNGDVSWEKEKRIVSPKYFKRYFVYSVLNDEISDVYFDEYIKALTTRNYDELLAETDEILAKIDSMDFLNKISFYEDKLDWDQKKSMINLIVGTASKFEGLRGGSFIPGFYNPQRQATKTNVRLLNFQADEEEKMKIAIGLLKTAMPFEFKSELMWWFARATDEDKPVFSEEDEKILKKEYVEGILKEIPDVFEKYEGSIFSLMNYWYDYDQNEVHKYFENYLAQSENTGKEIINAFTPTIYSSSNPEPYKIDFKKDSYELLKKYCDVETLYSKIILNHNDEIEKEPLRFFDMDEGQTVVNAMRQFVHWYEEDRGNFVEIVNNDVSN